MRGPKDNLVEAATRGLETPPFPEGKAARRLELFDEQRGMPAPTPTQEEAAPGPARRKGRARSLEVDPTAVVAATYAAAAVALQAPPQTRELAAPGAPQAAPPPSWRFLGPTGVSNGQTYGESRVIVSGRVAAIAVDPSNTSHVLCGGAGGGVWETRNTGASWAPRSDTAPTLTVGAIAFDPSAPTTVYCGTGEGNFYWRLGAGILRSTDGGTTWSLLVGAPFVGQGFYDLIVDPANGAHLLAATTRGIYESSDGGATWSQRRASTTWDLAMRPSGGASAEVLAGCRDGLFRSADGGTSWTAVTLPGAPAAWDRLAVSHVRSNPAVAYAFGSSGGTAHLYRRDAAGAWTELSLPTDLDTSQAWYDWFVAAAPDRVDQVYIGAIEAYRADLSGTTWTWVKISNKAGDDIHPDMHAITFDPTNPDVVYIGCDGGLFRSPNRGTNWTSLNPGLGITEIEYLAQDWGASRWLLAGTQDNGSIRWQGGGWEHVADGDGGDCGVNRAAPNIVFHTYYGMGMDSSATKGAWGSWTWRGPNVSDTYQALFYPPLEANTATVAMAGQSVYVSRDNANTWTEVALPANVMASAMYAPTANRIFVGTTGGRLFRLDWSGSAWGAATELTSPRLPTATSGAWVSDIAVDPGNPNRIWVSYSTLGDGRLFRSDDGGSTWTDRTAGLPALPINAIEIDPRNGSRVWVAADIGVYQSFDSGATWAAFSLGLPNALVEDLLYHPNARVLRCGTRNRGVWEIPVDGWLTQPVVGAQFTGSVAGNGSKRWFTFNWPATWHVVWTVMPTSVRPGAPQVTWTTRVERASAEFVTYWITVTNLTPDPVNVEGRYAILSYY